MLVNILVFFIIALFSLIPFNTEIFNPIKEVIRDFKFTDLYYSKLRDSSNLFDREVVLVNIANSDRAEIAEIINNLNTHDPKVIALDILFMDLKESYSDSLLKAAFKSTGDKLVLSSYLEEDQGKYALFNSNYWFGEYDNGYANFVGSNPKTSTIRYFRPSTEVNGLIQNSFAYAIVDHFSPDKNEALIKRDNKTERINYLGNYDKFVHFDAIEVNAANPDLSIIKDKIVMLGYMGPSIGVKTFEDIYFTPLNQEIAGRSFPDTYGIVIHANVVSMVLREDYINQMSKIFSYFIAFFICYLHVILFTYYFVNSHVWNNMVAKLAQIVTSILLLYIIFIFYSKVHYEMKSTLIIVSIILSVDVLYLYDSIVVYIFKKSGKRSYFIVEHK